MKQIGLKELLRDRGEETMSTAQHRQPALRGKNAYLAFTRAVKSLKQKPEFENTIARAIGSCVDIGTLEIIVSRLQEKDK